MNTIIITGANGFIGSRFVQFLSSNTDADIIAVVRNRESCIKSISGLDRVRIEFCDMKHIKNLVTICQKDNPDLFYHLAWEGATGEKRANYEVQLANVKNTCDALLTANQLGCKRFLCAGTISEQILAQLSELEKVSQNFVYALAKNQAHQLIDIISKQFDIETVWMQFSNIYGPGNRSGNLLSYTFNEIKKGNSPTYGNGLQPYDFLFIDDLIYAMKLLGCSENLTSSVYFIGSGHPQRLKDYLQRIPFIIHKDIEMKIGYREDDNIRYEEQWFEINNLAKDTGFSSKVSFTEGIRRTYRWMEEEV